MKPERARVEWRTLDIQGASGPIANTRLTQGAPRLALVRPALDAARAAADYTDLLVMGKSLGTTAMAELMLDAHVAPTSRTIWLTPLLHNETTVLAISSLRAPALVVIGTEDPSYDRGVLDSLVSRGHNVVVIEHANHGLAIDGDAAASAAIPPRLVAAVHAYVDAGHG